MKASCADNTITLGSSLPDVEYYVGEATKDFQIVYTTSVATNACPLDAKLYIKNDSTGAWDAYIGSEVSYPYVVSNSLLTTNTAANNDAGFFQINQATKTGYQPEKTITFKVVVTDLQATSPNGIAIEDEWTVTIYDKCSRNDLTLTTASLHSDVTHTIEADGASPATAVT